MKILIFAILYLSVKSFDFGITKVELNKISGTPVVLNLTTEKNGTTTSTDLSITNLKLYCCGTKTYDITCHSTKLYELSNIPIKFNVQSQLVLLVQ